MTITLFVPVVMALVTTAREALYAIFEDESAKAALKARTEGRRRRRITEAESNASFEQRQAGTSAVIDTALIALSTQPRRRPHPSAKGQR